MGHQTLNPALGEIALARLDSLIAEIGNSSDSITDLLIEHLKSARAYLLGAMPEEYEFSLITAKQLAARATDTVLQTSVMPELAVLLEQMVTVTPPHPLTPRPRSHNPKTIDGDKSELYQFFHGPATSLGVFYPTHYIFASFPSLQNATNAANALQAAGFQESVATSASETFRFMNEMRSEAGIVGSLMASLSRFLGTEEVFTDIDLAKAREGAAFLAVYCPREEQAYIIRDLVAPFEPFAMQLYLPSGIQSLLAGKSPGPQGIHPNQN